MFVISTKKERHNYIQVGVGGGGGGGRGGGGGSDHRLPSFSFTVVMGPLFCRRLASSLVLVADTAHLKKNSVKLGKTRGKMVAG